MTTATKQARYTYETLRTCLVNYLGVREGGRMPSRDDRLGVQRPRLEGAVWENTVVNKADVEMALRACSATFDEVMVTFEHLSRGGDQRARYATAKRWGIAPAKVRAMTDLALQRMLTYLNG